MTLNRASLKTFADTFSNCIVIISSDAVQPRTCLLFVPLPVLTHVCSFAVVFASEDVVA